MHPMWNGAFTATWRLKARRTSGAVIPRYDEFWEKSNDITGISQGYHPTSLHLLQLISVNLSGLFGFS